MRAVDGGKARRGAPRRSERGSRPTRRRPGPERAREILAAAREVFSARGYEQASMAEIAARVGVVEGALYKHFASKRELLFAVMRGFYESLIESLREGLRGVRGARNRLRFVIWSQLRAFTEEAGLCRVVIREIRPQGDYEQSLVRGLNRDLTGIALGVIEEAVAAGELRADVPPAMVRDVIYGGIEHLAWNAVNGRGSLDVERTADALTDLILGGVGVRAEEAPGAPERLAAQLDRLERALRRKGA
jgi:AcrR family transcriptional regulator